MATQVRRLRFGAAVSLLVAAGALLLAPAVNAESPAATNSKLTAGIAPTGGDHDKPWVCHPVEGAGETGYGWNLINPDKASSHIDEATGAGFHTRSDGRTDVYAVNGQCPGGPPPTDPPVTDPPTTEPPTTEPATTEPPTTEPPTTEPPVTTDPSTTDPPTTDPPETTEPTPTDPTTPPTEPTTPPTDPTDPTDPTTTVPAVVPPTTGGSSSGGSGGATTVSPTLAPMLGQLPETGTATTPIAVIAGSLLLVGGLALLATRRGATR